ncbi:hypothetical protein [Micromonospora purpureochromogenes]|nr:hypothetical protein [Micromonospora purpureochromogenes]
MPSFDIRSADLRAVNSMTKYPSIPTYHALDPGTAGCARRSSSSPGR